MTDVSLQLNAWTENPGNEVFCVQGEQNSRTLSVTLIDRTGNENGPLNVAKQTPRYLDLTGYTARMYVEKKDGTSVYFDGDITDPTNGKVSFTLPAQAVALPGTVPCTIELTNGTSQLKVLGIKLNVQESDFEDSVESSDDFSALDEALKAVGEISTATNAANAAADRANQAADRVEPDVTQLQTDVGELDSMMDAQVALTQTLQQWIAELRMDVDNTLLKAYPVGSIYLSVSSTNPGTLFGGTWVEWGKGRVAVGVDAGQTEFATVEKTGGEKTHKLTTAEMPSHSHQIDLVNEGTTDSSDAWQIAQTTKHTYTTYTNTKTSGGDQPHNNLQPYITCYMFKRTA